MQSIKKTRVTTEIDFDRPGKQSDFIRVPFSSNMSAFGWIPVPITFIANGEGPVITLIAGVHGDEYEGQIALLKIARELMAEDVQGKIIILHALNFPAVKAGQRLSPIDDANLNRVFPGDPYGSPTEMIAHYLDSVLFPMSDIVIDLHAGGRSLDHFPVAIARVGQPQISDEKVKELSDIFGAPYSVFISGDGGAGSVTLNAAAARQGIAALTVELGSGGGLSAEGLSLADAGVRRVLNHYDVVRNPMTSPPAVPKPMKFAGAAGEIYARHAGLFEPWVQCGQVVETGQPAGLLHFFEDPLREPEMLSFDMDGVVVCRRFATLCEMGDCLFVLITEDR